MRERIYRPRRRVLKAGLGIAGATAVGSLLSRPVSAAPTTVSGGGNNLRDAIDDASDGDTIAVVDSETYSSVEIDKAALTVTVEGDETPAIDGSGGEAAVSVTAAGVTFEGFTVTNQGGLLGIKIEGGLDDVTISDNTVDGVGPTGSAGVTGIILGNGDNDSIEISNNVVENLDQESDGGYATVNGIFADGTSGNTLSNSSIANNTVRELESDVAPLGILINRDAENVSISNNEITRLVAAFDTDSNDEDGMGEFDTFAQGINITSPTTTNVRITRNDISDVRSGDGRSAGESGDFNGQDGGFKPEAVKIDGDGGGTKFRANSLRATIGLNNQNGNADAPTVDAKNNYWGSRDGPETASGNLAADGDDRADVIGNVDFEPSLRREPGGRNDK